MRCKICNCEISSSERFCHGCGSPVDLSSGDEPRKLKKLWILWVCAAIALFLIGIYTVHIWEDPTCTRPETCKICQKTRGDVLGHSWKAATCTDPQTCASCGKIKGFAQGHDWQDATCLYPKYCADCDATEGEALPHNWVSATCEDPMYCYDCGSITGDALGHDWISATYTAPKTCAACGETEGQRLGELGTIYGVWAQDATPLGEWNIYTLILDQTINKCDSFTVYVDAGEDYETLTGLWDIYVKTTAGKWVRISQGMIYSQESWHYVDVYAAGYDTISFTEIGLVPVNATFSSYTMYYEVQDVHVTG